MIAAPEHALLAIGLLAMRAAAFVPGFAAYAPPHVHVSPAVTDASAFDTYVTMRTGAARASDPRGLGTSSHVFWYCVGELYDTAGKVLAHVEGWDAAAHVRVDEDHVRQLSRKIFFYFDPVTKELMEHKEIKYPYQVIDYTRGPAGTILASVVQGSGERQRSIAGNPVTMRRVGASSIFQAPVFIDMVIPGRGRYQSWEIYDFTVDPSYESAPFLTWVRSGPALGEPVATMHLTGSRVSSFEELPASLVQHLDAVEGGALWRAPPVDMAEIEQLQKEDGERQRT